MPPNIEKDICKMNIDLWMHQNTIMFSRLQTLWFVQFGLLALASYLYVPHPLRATAASFDLGSLARFVALLSAVATFGLWVMMRTDRIIRNIYRRKIEELKLDFFPGSVGQTSYDKDRGTNYVEPIFYYVVFSIFIGIDLYAARIFGLSDDVLCPSIGMFVAISLAIPIAERVLARKDASS